MATVVAIVISLVIMVHISFSNGSKFSSNSTSCIESEKLALLMFKRGLVDPINRLVSWAPDAELDCCRWMGVVCDNWTGHVLKLHLGLPPLDDDIRYDVYERSKLIGKINPSLSNLKHLRYLDLSNNAFEGKINPCLCNLEHLRYLNLSNNAFEGKTTPCLSNLKHLRYLDLSRNMFELGGILPYQLGNLSNLQTLNLGFMGIWLYAEDLQWLSGLSSLRHLDLSFVNLSSVSNWLHVINSLPYLEELILSDCELSLVPPLPFPNFNNLSVLTILDLSRNYLGNNRWDFGWVFNLHSLAFLNLEFNHFEGPIPHVIHNMSTSLRHLDLSDNSFNSSMPHWIYNLSTLEVLRVGSNHLQGEISSDIGKMTSLNELDLSGNHLKGKLPASMGNLCNLRSINFLGQRLKQSVSHIFEFLSKCSAHKLESLKMGSCYLFGGLTDKLGHFKNLRTLSLQDNSISGPIPTCIGQLANLEEVEIGNNLLEGVVSELHFANLTKLKYFLASDNSLLMLKVHPNWVPPFQLYSLDLRSWPIGPLFPSWLLSQKQLVSLDISNSNISDSIPPFFWRLSTGIIQLNLSHNHIHGQFEYIPNNSDGSLLDLSFNCFSGPLPSISVPSNYYRIDLSSNYFSGSLFHPLCDQLNYVMATRILILSGNLLSGEIPDCWNKWRHLVVLKLDDNRFTGKIPPSLGSLHALKYLNLYRNSLHGEIPLSLKSCTRLQSINLGENQIQGNIPEWFGHSFPHLIILSLRSNKLWGNIPGGLCKLTTIQILDLANNTLFGTIPKCIYNFTVMAERNNSGTRRYIGFVNLRNPSTYHEITSVIMKGQFLEYSNTLNLVRVVDFSSNSLSGEIPQEVTTLKALQSLNLSHNTLNGKIPQNLGAMQSLESLDLSQNQLSGSIPTSMSSLTFLSRLNLSYNNLTGQIPSSTQLQSFNASSYSGNNLCGPPLEDCINGTGNGDNITHAKRFKMEGFYISMVLGFIVGFWSLMVPIVINRRWRFTYYGFLEQMWWRLHDFVNIYYCH